MGEYFLLKNDDYITLTNKLAYQKARKTEDRKSASDHFPILIRKSDRVSFQNCETRTASIYCVVLSNKKSKTANNTTFIADWTE